MFSGVFFFQAEDGIRDLVRSRGLGDVYKRQVSSPTTLPSTATYSPSLTYHSPTNASEMDSPNEGCLLYTSDAADERSSVDLGGRRIIKKKKDMNYRNRRSNCRKLKQRTMTTN